MNKTRPIRSAIAYAELSFGAASHDGTVLLNVDRARTLAEVLAAATFDLLVNKRKEEIILLPPSSYLTLPAVFSELESIITQPIVDVEADANHVGESGLRNCIIVVHDFIEM